MIQVACTIWGTEYDASYVNTMVRAVRKYYGGDLIFVCISEDLAIKVDPGVIVRPFPDIGVDFRVLVGRCLPKLSIFVEGALPESDVKTVYIDLDTMIFGDIGRIASMLDDKNDLFLMEILPAWVCRVIQFARRVFPPFDITYGANSSVMVFYPRSFHWLGELYKHLGPILIMPEAHPARVAFPVSGWVFLSDQRFISYFARKRIKIVPSKLAAKFRDEWSSYLTPWIARARGLIPAVRKRRENFVVVTFNNPGLKRDLIKGYEEGGLVKLKIPFAYWGNQRHATLTKYLIWARAKFSDYWET